MKKIFLILIILVALGFAGNAFAHQPVIVFGQTGEIQVKNPDISRAFYDELKGSPRDYFIDSDKDFILYINLLVPGHANEIGKYSAVIFRGEEKIALVDGDSFEWKSWWEPFGRDWYMQGPELTQQVPAGKYKIEVYSKDNLGKYVLAVGQTESFDIKSLLNVYWQLPLLKLTFFKTSILQFFLTPFGIGLIAVVGGLLILLALIYFVIGFVKETIKHNQAKTLLLTSGGMLQMQDEIIKLLQKPAYDVTVGFINTAAKPEEDKSYLQRDLDIMKELGFNVEQFDIEGKKEHEVMDFLRLKDIVYVEGGSTFYLLKAMRACNFEKVIRKLLKQGKVYIGVSAGTLVAGRTIKTSSWKHPEQDFRVKNLRGLNLVPFDIFVHYLPEHAELIKQKIKNPKKRAKNLRILTDDQAILVQGKEVDLIGDGEAVII
ncbi:MAG: Type 1 glutamine amidotransferase-like domain-containing protein [Candidatus Staskawiczbacteria bacterium]|nr:Type 1 glutamine amidotransferase-like domain-containing protein [Candidatus Staskawiczbacteria bacterium]